MSMGTSTKNLSMYFKQLCFTQMRSQKVATLEGVHNELKKNRVVTFDIASQQIGEILNSMVLDNDIIEVRTGLGDYHSIPIGTICYRVAGGAGVARGPRMGAFASIPGGACSRISLCTPDVITVPADPWPSRYQWEQLVLSSCVSLQPY
ncbi:hypothetical protein Pfo_000412 [Paulownia fortunei]|nr:hypothetical protein Pfo_000412 [Paulownia fortunei]